MSASRSPFFYSNPGNMLNGVSLRAYEMFNTYRGYSSDFVTWEGPTAEGTDGGLILRGAVGAGTITRPATQNIGVIRLTTQATAGGDVSLEIPAQFGYVVGKRIWFLARFALSDVDDIQMILGLGTPGTADPMVTAPVEGIYFAKASDTDQDPDFIVRDNSTSTSNTALTGTTFLATNDAFYYLGFTVSVGGAITPYYGTSLSALTAGTAVAAGNANLPDDAGDELSIYVGCLTGNGEADYLDLDQLICVQER